MALTLTTPNTLLGLYQPKTEAARLWSGLATVILGTVLLTVAAKISVPVMPVPVTLQSLAVALLAATFGARIAVATVALYLVEGLAGLPVFATGGGIDYMFRPSFGFIVGWLPMAWIIGTVADRSGTRNFFTLVGSMIVADAVSFVFGFAWLVVVANMIVGSGAELPGWLNGSDLVSTAYAGAVAPFIGWDVLKMAFAAITVTGASLALFRRKAQ